MTRLEAIRGDITTLDVDVIVNAANRSLMGGGGVDGAIHRAGGSSILEECKAIVASHGPLPTGEAVVTTGGNLPARHVIHTVGPIWGKVPDEAAVDLLGSCYRSSLDLAARLSARSIAFPNISTGVYGFPKRLAAETATAAIEGWVAANPNVIDSVILVCFDPESLAIYQGILRPV